MRVDPQDDLSPGYIAARSVTDEDIQRRDMARAEQSDAATADLMLAAEPRQLNQEPEPASEQAATPVDTNQPETPASEPQAPSAGGFTPTPGALIDLGALKAGGDFIANLPRNIAVGGAKAMDNISTFLYDRAGAMATPFAGEPISGAVVKEGVNILIEELAPGFDSDMREIFKASESDTTGDRMVQGMAEFLLPFSAFTKVNAAMGLTGTLSKQAANAVLADLETSAIALDPHMERFAGLLQEFEVANDVPLIGPFIDYLTDDTDTGDTAGRWKNALDSISANAAFAGVLFGAGSLFKFGRDLPRALRHGLDGAPVPGLKRAQRGAVGNVNLQTNAGETSGLSVDIKEFEAAAIEKHGLDSFDLSVNGDDITLSMFEVPKAKRKQGIGSSAIEDLVDFADANGKRIKLSPDSKNQERGTTSRTRLIKFYKRFGFVENKGRNKDFTIRESLLRNPK